MSDSSMTNIFLVRHGQTEWNQQNRLQGHKNSPLTQMGRQQATKTREALLDQTIDKAYVSPLQRAQDTLGIILEGRDIETTVTKNLKEINLGPWEGKTREETKESHPLEYDKFWNQQDQFILDGAETYQQLQVRMIKELDAILAKEQGKNILVVSHWIAIKTVIAHYTSTPISKLTNMPDLQNGNFLTLQQLDNNVWVEGL
jgi:phosphoserine phosphatase